MIQCLFGKKNSAVITFCFLKYKLLLYQVFHNIWCTILKKLLNEKWYKLYLQSCIKQRNYRTDPSSFPKQLLKFMWRSSYASTIDMFTFPFMINSYFDPMMMVIVWRFYCTRLMFYISEMTDTDQMWHQRMERV